MASLKDIEDVLDMGNTSRKSTGSGANIVKSNQVLVLASNQTTRLVRYPTFSLFQAFQNSFLKSKEDEKKKFYFENKVLSLSIAFFVF